MDFEEFQNKILEKGYGIIGMNHYSLNGKLYLFCSIMNTKSNIAFKAEEENFQDVFEKLFNKIKNFEESE